MSSIRVLCVIFSRRSRGGRRRSFRGVMAMTMGLVHGLLLFVMEGCLMPTRLMTSAEAHREQRRLRRCVLTARQDQGAQYGRELHLLGRNWRSVPGARRYPAEEERVRGLPRLHAARPLRAGLRRDQQRHRRHAMLVGTTRAGTEFGVNIGSGLREEMDIIVSEIRMGVGRGDKEQGGHKDQQQDPRRPRACPSCCTALRHARFPGS
jgi:hypothetical protein